MATLQNKIDFAVIINVKNANPNGDPLNGNRPRTDYEGRGEISDVCIKRKIRDRLMEAGQKVFVQSDDRKNDDATSLKDRAEKALGKDMGGKNVVEKACAEWIDVRAFGQLFAFSGKKNKNKDDAGNGDDANGKSVPIRGPVSIQHAFSRDIVSVTSTQITKSVNSEDTKDGKRSSDTMGMKYRVDNGIYVFLGSMNPQLAQRTKFSTEDALLIKNVLPKLFENDSSSARPEGSMQVLKVIWWEQQGSGKYSSAKVHGTLNVNTDGTYVLSNLNGLTPEEIEGF
ncbi:MAG: type I-C CRISPR-associated protein Cas7/Csd2 [Chitinispirillaceae bacterium]|nr:type I-C CRISPR-associated protein Cas7/Csd2 [Chitinispirillaceae bacterium]